MRDQKNIFAFLPEIETISFKVSKTWGDLDNGAQWMLVISEVILKKMCVKSEHPRHKKKWMWYKPIETTT